MKKVMLVIVGVLVLSFLFGAAGFAYAQTQNPQDETVPFGTPRGQRHDGAFRAGHDAERRLRIDA